MEASEALGHLTALLDSDPTFSQIIEVYKRTPAVRAHLHTWMCLKLDRDMLRSAERGEIILGLCTIEDLDACSKLMSEVRHMEPALTMCEAGAIAAATHMSRVAEWAIHVMSTMRTARPDETKERLLESLLGISESAYDDDLAHQVAHFEHVAIGGETDTARGLAAGFLMHAHRNLVLRAELQPVKNRRADERDPYLEWDTDDALAPESELTLRKIVETALINIFACSSDEERVQEVWTYLCTEASLLIVSEWWLATVTPDEPPKVGDVELAGVAADALGYLLNPLLKTPKLLLSISATFARSEEVAVEVFMRLCCRYDLEESLVLEIGRRTAHERVRVPIREALLRNADRSLGVLQWLLQVVTEEDDLKRVRDAIQSIQRPRDLVEGVVRAFGDATPQEGATPTNGHSSASVPGYFDRFVSMQNGRPCLLPTLHCG